MAGEMRERILEVAGRTVYTNEKGGKRRRNGAVLACCAMKEGDSGLGMRGTANAIGG
jgi:hypothetical protein